MARSSKQTHVSRDARRKPLSKDMLLPLPTAKVRAMSLENHLALAILCRGQGNVEQIFYLLRVVYLTYFLRDTADQEGGIDMFRAAEEVLERSVTRAEQGREWSLCDDGCALLQQLLALHDRQLAAAPVHRFQSAMERLQRFASSDAPSPIGAA